MTFIKIFFVVLTLSIFVNAHGQEAGDMIIADHSAKEIIGEFNSNKTFIAFQAKESQINHYFVQLNVNHKKIDFSLATVSADELSFSIDARSHKLSKSEISALPNFITIFSAQKRMESGGLPIHEQLLLRAADYLSRVDSQIPLKSLDFQWTRNDSLEHFKKRREAVQKAVSSSVLKSQEAQGLLERISTQMASSPLSGACLGKGEFVQARFTDIKGRPNFDEWQMVGVTEAGRCRVLPSFTYDCFNYDYCVMNSKDKKITCQDEQTWYIDDLFFSLIWNCPSL